MTIVAALEHARDRTSAGDAEAALAALVGAWRAVRSERIAALIDAVGRRLVRPPIDAPSQGARHAAWLGLVAANDHADVPRLLAMLADGYPARARERLEALAARPPDPRIAAALVALIVEPPTVTWVKPASRELWDAVVFGIAHHGGPVHRRALGALAWLRDEDRAPSPFSNDGVRRRVIRLAAPVILAGEDEPALSVVEVALCDELVLATAAVDRGPALLAAVLASPADRGARAVYADWLLERGDPRGEHIALQLARGPGDKPSKRERDLEEAGATAWLGGLGAYLGHWELRDGFLHDASLAHDRGLPPIVPALATVVQLGGTFEEARDLAFVADPVFRALRHAGTFTLASLVALGRGPRALALERAGAWTPHDEPLVPDGDLAVPALPELRRLDLQPTGGGLAPERLGALWRSPLFAQLAHLDIAWGGGAIAGWIDAFAALATLGELTLYGNQFWRLRLARIDGRVALDAEVIEGGYGPASGGDTRMRGAVFDWLAAETRTTTSVDEVQLTDARWYGADPQAIASVTAPLARLTGREVRVVTGTPPPPRRVRRR